MVLKRLFRREPEAAPSAVPDDVRVYAVGDVHGRLDLLDEILSLIEADARSAAGAVRIVFLGDLVDRGPHSAQVIDRLIELSATRDCRFIAGNHEEVFLKALGGDREALRFFIRIGGRETILSYGVDEAAYDQAGYDELLEMMQAAVPPAHAAFLHGFEDQLRIGDYLFVHAGIRPGVPFDEQERADLRWIRRSFLDHVGGFGAVVVHGHSISEDVDERPNRIGIDTGAYRTGRLTALVLDGSDRWYLNS